MQRLRAAPDSTADHRSHTCRRLKQEGYFRHLTPTQRSYKMPDKAPSISYSIKSQQTH